MLDVALLRKSVDWATAEAAKPIEQSEWCQESWKANGATLGRDCGTTYCIAGHIVASALGPDKVRVHGIMTGIHAAELLGVAMSDVLWDDGSHGLFGTENTIEDVRREAEELAARNGEVL